MENQVVTGVPRGTQRSQLSHVRINTLTVAEHPEGNAWQGTRRPRFSLAGPVRARAQDPGPQSHRQRGCRPGVIGVSMCEQEDDRLSTSDLCRHRGYVRSARGARIDHRRAPPTHDVAAGPFKSEGTRIPRIYPAQIRG